MRRALLVASFDAQIVRTLAKKATYQPSRNGEELRRKAMCGKITESVKEAAAPFPDALSALAPSSFAFRAAK